GTPRWEPRPCCVSCGRCATRASRMRCCRRNFATPTRAASCAWSTDSSPAKRSDRAAASARRRFLEIFEEREVRRLAPPADVVAGHADEGPGEALRVAAAGLVGDQRVVQLALACRPALTVQRPGEAQHVEFHLGAQPYRLAARQRDPAGGFDRIGQVEPGLAQAADDGQVLLPVLVT